MKRYGNLFEKVCDPRNIRIALWKAAKGKARRRGVARALARDEEIVGELSDMLRTGRYVTSRYHCKNVYEPKFRTIYSLPFFPDRIAHHAIMNVLEPIWDRILDENSFSCRRKARRNPRGLHGLVRTPSRKYRRKGTHAGSKRCAQFIRRYKYVLQCDVSKFYPSIDHEILKGVIRKKIKDERMLALLDGIIDSANSIEGAIEGKNTPIGNLLSQWMGNLYLNEMDVWLRNECGVHAFIRYTDDFLLFSDSKKWLNAMRERIVVFLRDTLKLRLSKAKLYPVERGADFLGYRHFPKRILVRRRVARKIKRTARKACLGLYRHYERVRGKISSMWGVLVHATSTGLRRAVGIESLKEIYEVCLKKKRKRKRRWRPRTCPA